MPTLLLTEIDNMCKSMKTGKEEYHPSHKFVEFYGIIQRE